MGARDAGRRLVAALRLRAARIALLVFAVGSLAMLVAGTVMVSQGTGNMLLNLGSELFGTVLTVIVIGPMLRAGQEGSIRSYPGLNYRRFVERSAGARRQVQILTTFSTLLKHRETENFLRQVVRLVGRGVRVEVLLLHPDSLTADQRQRELFAAGARVTEEIHDNVRVLASLIDDLSDPARRQLAVRLYDASASVIMHRWDDRGLISFLHTDKLAEEGSHLEIDMRSPLGVYIEARFLALWVHPRTVTLERFLRERIMVLVDGRERDEMDVRYVTHGDDVYVVSSQLLAARARHPADGLRARRAGVEDLEYEVVMPGAEDAALLSDLTDTFERKYGTRPHTLVRMRPTPSQRTAR